MEQLTPEEMEDYYELLIARGDLLLSVIYALMKRRELEQAIRGK